MAAAEYRLNLFERILFGVAVALAMIIIAVRLGAIAAFWWFHH